MMNNTTLISAIDIFKGQFLHEYYNNHITFNIKEKIIIFLEHIKLKKSLSDTFIDIPKGWDIIGNKYTINISNTYNCDGLFKINNKQNSTIISKIDSIGIFGTHTKLNKRRSYFCKPCPNNVVLSNCYNRCDINNEHCSAFLPLGCDSCTIMYSFNTGDMTSNFCGGFVVIGKNITIKNSFNIGNIYGMESSGFIQFVEFNCTILNCYYAGIVKHENYVYFQTYIPKYRKNPIIIKNCYDTTTNSLWTNTDLSKIDISNCYSLINQHKYIHNIKTLKEISSDFVHSPTSIYPILKCFQQNAWNIDNYQNYQDIPIFKYYPQLIEEDFTNSYTMDINHYYTLILYFHDNTHEELYIPSLHTYSNNLFLSNYKCVHENQTNVIDYLRNKQKQNPIIGIQTSHHTILNTAYSHQVFLHKDIILKLNPKSVIQSNILYRLFNPIYENMSVINISNIRYVQPLQSHKKQMKHEKPKNCIQLIHSNIHQLSSLWTKSSTRYYPYTNFKIDNKY
jgi:hypothetical protein